MVVLGLARKGTPVAERANLSKVRKVEKRVDLEWQRARLHRADQVLWPR